MYTGSDRAVNEIDGWVLSPADTVSNAVKATPRSRKARRPKCFGKPDATASKFTNELCWNSCPAPRHHQGSLCGSCHPDQSSSRKQANRILVTAMIRQQSFLRPRTSPSSLTCQLSSRLEWSRPIEIERTKHMPSPQLTPDQAKFVL